MHKGNLLWLLVFLQNSIFPTTYRLTHPPYEAGFFNIFNTILGTLDFYDRDPTCNGLIIDFENKGLYYDPNYGSNWFEYYFEPISCDITSTAKKFPLYRKITFSVSSQFIMSRKRGYELIQKYIRIKPTIQMKLNAFTETYFKDNHVIGIHYRGTDKKVDGPLIPYEEVCDVLALEVHVNSNVLFFVATDDENFLMFIQEKFPGHIISTSAFRSNSSKPIHYPRSKNAYQLGQDALLDCLLLAQCSKLYRTTSNLSSCSLKFNPSMPVIDLTKNYKEEIHPDRHTIFMKLHTVLYLLDQYEKGIITGFESTVSTEYNNPLSEKKSNWWQRYFKEISTGNPDTSFKITDYMIDVFGPNNLFEMNPLRANELITKYIKLEPALGQQIDIFMTQNRIKPYIISLYYDGTQNSFDLLNQLDKELQEAPANYTIILVSTCSNFSKEVLKRYKNVIKPELSIIKNNELKLAHAMILSKSTVIIGCASELLKVACQFNPRVKLYTFGTLWMEKD